MAQFTPLRTETDWKYLVSLGARSPGSGQFTKGATATKSRERSTAVSSLVRPDIRDFSCIARRKIRQRLRQVVRQRLAGAKTAALQRRTCERPRHAVPAIRPLRAASPRCTPQQSKRAKSLLKSTSPSPRRRLAQEPHCPNRGDFACT